VYAQHNPGKLLGEAFEELFGQAMPPTLNASHQLIIVASELDASTERIVSYAAHYDIPLNVVFFRYFRDGSSEYLARSWLIDPAEAEERSRSSRRRRTPQDTWNGTDFYFSAGEGRHRNWDDMVRYGFISAGGGRWYSNSLKLLEPGHRIFANIPGTGYVGVGVVRESVQPSIGTDRGNRPSGSRACTPIRTRSRAYASDSRSKSSHESSIWATRTTRAPDTEAVAPKPLAHVRRGERARVSGRWWTGQRGERAEGIGCGLGQGDAQRTWTLIACGAPLSL
jgi:hypothetical protein